MRRLLEMSIAGGALIILLTALPHWTAVRAEANRKADFETASRRLIPGDLPLCPAAGPGRDAFLRRSAGALTGSSSLWVPVCRIAPLPAHYVVVTAKTRAELGGCDAARVWRPANVICFLDEPLGFLADSEARRTWARRESGGIIWTTSAPMAWQDHLVSQHRQWMMLGLFVPATLLVLVLAVQRTGYAFSMRATRRAEEELGLPANAEFLLHWVLGRSCRSLPGDLSQEYLDLLDAKLSRTEADRWYRWQVFHSIAPVMARRIESILTKGLWPTFTRRS
jgi:hypothetical protein